MVLAAYRHSEKEIQPVKLQNEQVQETTYKTLRSFLTTIF